MLEVFTTVATEKQAKTLVNLLLASHLVVCVSFWPVSSVYPWKGKIRSEKEWMLCIKTSEKLRKKLERKIKRLHPYKLPVISFSRFKVDKNVEKWIYQCVK